MKFNGKLNQFPALTCAEDVKSICQPLFNIFDLNYFGYFRIYNNSEVVGLVTDPAWFEHFVQQGFCYQSGKRLTSGVHLWKNTHNQTIAQHAREYFNHDHGMFLIQENKDYVESAIFATDRNNEQCYNVCLNNLETYQCFVNYFKMQAEKILDVAEQHRLIIAEPLLTDEAENLSSEQTHNVFVTAKKYKQILVADRVVTITPEESICLLSIASGRSAGEIASLLHKSPRTVEKQIAHLMDKFSAHNGVELIAKIGKQLLELQNTHQALG